VQQLVRERAAFARILSLPQTRFAYRQRLRKAIAIRDAALGYRRFGP
jgi:hypothetical protein